ncbi:uncharacterized protein N7503_003258 [Penicillium pulvis]|uniref:uncharacterized protein n=1 Tax=Penicillium pulvis TaxID=1562058 RepID=UPI002546B12F|nr:uncharacterized protein N7503_003258 [Penicillium pulvis]KAJ5805656.1 hypothetical protein N7503_003258 [Penicillium pulvis]
MNSLRACQTAVAVAVAFLMPIITVANAAAQTTEFGALHFMFPVLDMSHVEGSVISADSTATTIKIECRSDFTNICTSAGYVLPQTFTTGPSNQGKRLDVTGYFAKQMWITSASLECDVRYTSLAAPCVRTTSSFFSSGTFSTTSTLSDSPTLSPKLTYKALTVMSGLDKLRTDSTGVITTTTSAPTVTVTSTTSTPDKSVSSSSEAWIAGPVIGGVAGVALAAGLAFWLIKRRRKANAGAEDIAHHELPADNQRPELPGESTPAELPGHKIDNKLELSAPNDAHELA